MSGRARRDVNAARFTTSPNVYNCIQPLPLRHAATRTVRPQQHQWVAGGGAARKADSHKRAADREVVRIDPRRFAAGSRRLLNSSSHCRTLFEVKVSQAFILSPLRAIGAIGQQ